MGDWIRRAKYPDEKVRFIARSSDKPGGYPRVCRNYHG